MAWALTRRGKAVNEATLRAAEGFKNVHAVNPWRTMTEFSARNIDHWAADKFHASAEGHGIFYRGAIPTIRKALEESALARVARCRSEEERDLPIGFLLVCGIRRVCGDDPMPPNSSLITG